MKASTRGGIWTAALVAAVALGGVVGLARADDAAPAGAKSILNMESYWRWHTTFRPPTVEPAGSGKQLSLPKTPSALACKKLRHWSAA